MSDSANITQAAILISNLPQAQAAKILSRLDPKDVDAVLKQSQRLEDVSGNKLLEVSANLKQQLSSRSSADNSQDDRPVVSGPVAQRKQPEPFEFLVELLPEARLKLLKDEHPKNVAMVLASICPQVASEILAQLEPAIRVSVLRRLCQTELFDGDQIDELATTLKLKLEKQIANQNAATSGLKRAASLLSCSTSTEQQNLLTFISQSDPELAERLERSVFLFDDLNQLSNQDIKTLLRHCDVSLWAAALKRAEHATRLKILNAMAKKAADFLSAEICQIVVDEFIAHRAQQEIISVVLRLMREGKISDIKSAA